MSTRGRSRIVGALVLVACALAFANAGASADAASRSAVLRPKKSFGPGRCPPVIFYGARGSGERLSSHLGLGPTLHAVYREMSVIYGSGNVGAVANGYWAVPVLNPRGVGYLPSVEVGVTSALADWKSLERECPGSAIVTAGYSQGADVIRRATLRMPATALRDDVLLFGDPGFHPAGTYGTAEEYPDGFVAVHGDFRQSSGGVYWFLFGTRPAFGNYQVQTWCHDKDPVCQAPISWNRTAAHRTYGMLDAHAAASSVAVSPPVVTRGGSAYVHPACGGMTAVLSPRLAGDPSPIQFEIYVDRKRFASRRVARHTVLKQPLDGRERLVEIRALARKVEQRRITALSC